MERLAWKGRMDLSRVYTKTSKGILEGNTKSREVTREHGRVLMLIDGKSSVADILEKSTRLSENRLAAILDELVQMGMIRALNAALAVDDFGFSSTIIVGESNTEAFFEAQVNHERELRRAEALAAQDKEGERTTLLNEVKADIQAEAESIKSDLAKRGTQEAQDKAQAGFQRAAEVQSRREADLKAKAEAKLRQAREDAEARAQALAEHARKQFASESKARQEAEARAKALQAEVFARGEAVRKAKQESAQRAQAEADAKARMEAEKKARLEAEKKALAAEKAQEVAESKARKVAEQATRLAKETEAKANAQRVLEAKIQAEEEAQRRAEMEARLRETEQGKRRAEEEARALAKAAEEQRIASELENRVKRRVEARTREVEAARERAEAEARAKQEEVSRLAQEAQARQQAEAAAAEAAQEVQAKLEAERQAHEIAEARALAEVEVQRQSDEARNTREAAEREAEVAAATQATAEAGARQHAEAEQRRIDAEKAAEAARLAAEKRAEEERKAQEARIKAEHEARRQAEAEQRRMEADKAAEAARLAAEKRAEEERKAQEARIKAEHEARRQAEVERRRIEAEKATAADAARVAAELKAEKERLHAERQAQEVAQAEQAVRLEAEAVKRQLAEQQRAEDERLEREKLALKREQERAVADADRALVETHARAENETRQREEARELARDRAVKAVRAEAAEALRHRQDAAQREEAEEHRMRGEAQSRAVAAARGAAVFPFLTSHKRTRARLSKNFIKPLFYSLLGLLVVAVAMLHLVPLNFYIPKLEQQLAESIGQRVVVRDLHFSLYPAPHLLLEGVTIGDLADVRIGSARVFPTFAAWYTEDKVIRRVELASVALSDDSLSALSIWSQHQAQTAPVQFEEIRVKDAKLQNRLLDLFTFDADLFMRQGRMAKAQIRSTDKRITIDITPQNEGLAIQLVATGSVLPIEPRLKFDGLKIAAITQPGSMTLTQIDGQLYGGSVSGNAQIDWRDGWVFKSDLAVRQIAIAPALALFTRNITVSGALEAKIRLAAKSDMLETLFNAPQVQATFRARDGEVASIDLVRAIQSARSNSNIGGKTHFNELSGNFQFANGRYQYQQLKLTTGMMSANGNVDLSAQQNLSGNLVGELRTRNTVLRMPFILGGTLVTPSLKIVAPVVRPPAPAPVVSEQDR